MSEVFSGAGGWWLGTFIGGGAVLLICGWLMRRCPSPAARQRLGEWGIVAAVLVAVLRMGPSWISVPDPWPEKENHQVELAVTPNTLVPMIVNPQLVWRQQPKDFVSDTPTIAANVPETATVEPETYKEPPQTGWTIGLIDGLLAGYAALAVFFFCRWLLGQWGLARILRQARPAPESVQQIFDQLLAETKQRRIRLCISDRVPVPMCCGLNHPTVVIPRTLASDCDPKILRWVFAHELTHLARRDTWSMWFMGFAQTFYFYLPLFWWVRRQVRLCQEYIADAAAARQGPWADDYAQFLVSLARSPAAPVGATGVLGNTSDLYRRVTMLLKSSKAPASPASRRQLLSGVSCLLASAVILAGLGVRAESPGDKKKEKDVVIEFTPVEVGNDVIVLVGDDDDKDDKKKDEKKDVILKRVQPAQGAVAVKIDHAAIEKKIRAALEKADLGEEEVKKVMKEIHQALEQAHKQIHAELMPKLGEMKIDALPKIAQLRDLKVEPPKMDFKFEPGQRAFMMRGAGGGRLGVMIEKPNAALVEHLGLDKDQGIVIQQVVKGSVAEKAGFKANDIVLKFGDKSVGDLADFIKIVDGVPADKEVKAIVIRKGKKEVIEDIKLGEKKKEGAMQGDLQFKWDAADPDVAKKFKAMAELHAKDAQKHAEQAKVWAEQHAKDAKEQVFEKKILAERLAKDGEKRAADVAKILAEVHAKAGDKVTTAEDAKKLIAELLAKGDKHSADDVKKILAEKTARGASDDKKSDRKETTRSVSVTVNDGEYSAKDTEGDLTITLKGTMDDGKVKLSSISINDGGDKTNYKSLDKVPSKYRARIEKLIAGSGDSPVRVRVRTDRDDD
jgi:beta-lactamase regulating signal transducer with metallopeptidase domain